VALTEREAGSVPGLESIRRDRYQTFFRTPFTGLSYVVAGVVRRTATSHPSSFYPGSPFDVFAAVKRFLQTGQLIVPRFYLYPCAVCNANCGMCQFRDRWKAPSLIPTETVLAVLDDFAAQSPRPATLATIVSGDGEPTMHPDFDHILAATANHGIRMFLTSNFLLPSLTRGRMLSVIADSVDMLTISIKGLTPSAYAHYQGLQASDRGFSTVLANLDRLLNALERNGRRRNVLVGVATIILPENTDHYLPMIDRFTDLGLDYVHLNVVEPSYSSHGISFNESEQRRTRETLQAVRSLPKRGTLVRFPADPFRIGPSQSVYYDATTRSVRQFCGSALFNPIVISNPSHDATMLSCRTSEHFTDPRFWYSHAMSRERLSDLVSDRQRIDGVMAATRTCRNCRLERQARLFDFIMKAEIDHEQSGNFLLDFPTVQLHGNVGAIAFEETF
jgi:wyosine [tRNA(Phe)-imidazoG37] synthetase (radical SAM superfamily)